MEIRGDNKNLCILYSITFLSSQFVEKNIFNYTKFHHKVES